MVLSLFSAYNFIKLLFSFVIPAEVLKVQISRLRFVKKVRLKQHVQQGLKLGLKNKMFVWKVTIFGLITNR